MHRVLGLVVLLAIGLAACGGSKPGWPAHGTLKTEGITWVTTGIGIGMALGSFAAGAVVDAFGAQNGFWVSVASGTIALATVLLGQRCLATHRCELDGCEAAAVPAE